MWYLPKTLRRDRPLEPLIADLVRGIRDFLESANLSESVLLLDGPGVGVSTSMIALALLGMDRIHAFREVYCTSGSTYHYLCFLAKEQGGLLFTVPGGEEDHRNMSSGRIGLEAATGYDAPYAGHPHVHNDQSGPVGNG